MIARGDRIDHLHDPHWRALGRATDCDAPLRLEIADAETATASVIGLGDTSR